MEHARSRDLMTADEFWDRQGDFPGCELVDGRIERVPPTSLPHGEAELHIGAALLSWGRPRGARVATGEVGYQLDASTVRGADVTVHLTAPDAARGWTKTPPDVVVEVVSPNDRWTELEQKAALWLDFGVREVWIADPATRRVLVRKPDGSAHTFRAGDTLGSGVLEGFSAPVDRLLPE